MCNIVFSPKTKCFSVYSSLPPPLSQERVESLYRSLYMECCMAALKDDLCYTDKFWSQTTLLCIQFYQLLTSSTLDTLLEVSVSVHSYL